MNHFGERLKKTLKEAGYTQAKVTEELELSKNAITNYVKGRIPDATILYKLSKVLGVSMEWLLTGEECKNNKIDEEDNKISHILGELTDREIKLIELFRQLEDDIERAKIEGMLEMKIYESKIVKGGMSSTYQSGEEAATKEKKHA